MADTDHDKIIRVEEKIGALSSVVYEIKDNHLVHLAKSIEDLHIKVDTLNIRIATYIGAVGVIIWLVNKVWK